MSSAASKTKASANVASVPVASVPVASKTKASVPAASVPAASDNVVSANVTSANVEPTLEASEAKKSPHERFKSLFKSPNVKDMKPKKRIIGYFILKFFCIMIVLIALFNTCSTLFNLNSLYIYVYFAITSLLLTSFSLIRFHVICDLEETKIPSDKILDRTPV